MTIKIEFKKTGKVVGIKGLYKDLSSGRFYVRANIDGLDKQVTIRDDCKTFSELKHAAERAINAMHKMAESNRKIHKSHNVRDEIEDGIIELQKQIVKIWTFRRTSEKKIKEYIRSASGLCLCSNKKFQRQVDEYNRKTLNEKIYSGEHSRTWQSETFKCINIIFRRLILSQVHLGQNPCDSIKKPRTVQNRVLGELDYQKAASVVALIRILLSDVKAAEAELFFRLCFETGQRPRDIYMFDCRNIDGNHYTFYSHKTERPQRVSHILSQDVLELISSVMLMRGKAVYKQRFKNEFTGNESIECFWSRSMCVYTKLLNGLIHSKFGRSITLYSCKHFFISEIFRITESDFWAEAFTHEGRTANTRHYLHPDQQKADEILSEYIGNFQERLSEQYCPELIHV